jgi:hypothetical protein
MTAVGPGSTSTFNPSSTNFRRVFPRVAWSLPACGRPSNAERCETPPPGSRWPTMARQWRSTTDSAGASKLEV